MASRQEQKEARRQERLEQEQAEAKSAANRRRLQLVGGGVLALAALAAVVIALVTVLGGSDDAEKPAGQKSGTEAAGAKLPAPQITDLDAAAKAAGCKLDNPAYEGATHEDKTFTQANYKTNPPTSGNHNPSWYEDGIYAPGSTPKLGELIHTLEHGRIDVQYRPGTSKAVEQQLEAFVGENQGYHMLMYENTTKMPFAVAATAWTHSLGCKTMNPKVFDALRTFRDRYIDKGPEKVP